MPIHDWSKVEDWLFHDFHTTWLIHLKEAMNDGLLPPGYRAFAEQRAELYIPDVLALTSEETAAQRNGSSNVAVVEPKTDRKAVVGTPPTLGRALTVRHTTGRRVVAIIEIVSPGNKDRESHVGDFAGKVASMVQGGVHAVVLDLLPPRSHDPGGMHGVIWSLLDAEHEEEQPPAGRPLTFASYRSADRPIAYLNFAKVGQPFPPVPLFLDQGQFVELPLESSYMLGYSRLPPEDRPGIE